ncbi:MAG TPA: hypothetical protein DCQ33_12615 [Nitrospira sp.]|nr:hypothetical protein [Nitrospira sp.]
MATRLQIAKLDIVRVFSQGPAILRPSDIAKVFVQNRSFWRLAQKTTLREFSNFMVEKSELRQVTMTFPQQVVSGYTWGKVPFLETLLGLVKGSYYSHYTAIRIHGLTEQLPKTVYLSREKHRGESSQREVPPLYPQEKIDEAFQRPPRMSSNQVELEEEGIRVMLLETAYHEWLGISTGEVNFGGQRPLRLRYTSLERTMIDIVVRPFYSGGVFEVAKAFENAKEQLSVNAMRAMLKKLRFGYPYHQVIGYYLERAGYRSSQVELFRREPMERDFYLTHGMGKTTYNSRWRLHVPEGF